MATVHFFKMFGTSHPVTKHYISDQNRIQYLTERLCNMDWCFQAAEIYKY